MSTATIPPVNYVTDSQGDPVFVQLPIQEWTSFVEEYQRIFTLLQFKARLKSALMEIRQIQKGEKIATPLSDFLHEL